MSQEICFTEYIYHNMEPKLPVMFPFGIMIQYTKETANSDIISYILIYLRV